MRREDGGLRRRLIAVGAAELADGVVEGLGLGVGGTTGRECDSRATAEAVR